MSATTVPRRAHDDDEFDDHDRLLMEIEDLAIRWTVEAARVREGRENLSRASACGTHAEQLRAIARAHTSRS